MWLAFVLLLSSAPPPPTFAPPRWPMPAEVHPLVRNMPALFEEDIVTVGEYIADRERDPYLRAKALHDYVATRLRYAIRDYERGTVQERHADPRSVFKSRLAVCAGYARLMVAIGRAARVEVRYVVGLVRLYLPKKHELLVTEHAWNAVRIDGRWLNVDATWDFGSAGDGEVHLSYSTDYLFTPDEVFSFTHLAGPSYPELRPRGLTEAEFRARPLLKPRFFVHGARLIRPASLVTTTSGRLRVNVDNTARAAVLARARHESGSFAACYTTHCGAASCGPDRVCWHDSCVEKSCMGGVCADGTRCRGGRCVVVSCREDAHCVPAERCSAGVCRGVNPFGDTAESAETLELTCGLDKPGGYVVQLSTRGANDPHVGSYEHTGLFFVENGR